MADVAYMASAHTVYSYKQWLNSGGTGRNGVPPPLFGVPPPLFSVPPPKIAVPLPKVVGGLICNLFASTVATL